MTDRSVGRALALGLVFAVGAPAGALAQKPTTPVAVRLGHPATARLLVINADDLGMAHSVNQATFEAFGRGWITSSTILVPCPWFAEVARFAKEHPEADLGLHLALNSEWTTFRWGPVTGRGAVPSLLDDDGYLPLDSGPVVANARPEEVERELRAQIETALRAGIRPSHFDTHMETLMQSASLIRIYRRLGREYGVPIRASWDRALPEGEPGWGPETLLDRTLTFDAAPPRGEWRGAYEKMLAPLPPGVYELAIHLAHDDAEMQGATFDHPDWGAGWRQADLEVMGSAEFQRFLRDQGFILVSWRDLARALPEGYARKP
jgi:predicted glycoside hydrolase/deacetylase ChbG (UPF0249 family)